MLLGAKEKAGTLEADDTERTGAGDEDANAGEEVNENAGADVLEAGGVALNENAEDEAAEDAGVEEEVKDGNKGADDGAIGVGAPNGDETNGAAVVEGVLLDKGDAANVGALLKLAALNEKAAELDAIELAPKAGCEPPLPPPPKSEADEPDMNENPDEELNAMGRDNRIRHR